MHQRKLHLLALYENDLLASRLNDRLSLWVRGNSPQCISKGCVCKRHNCCTFSASFHLAFSCTMKPCLKGSRGLASKQDFCLSVHYLKMISKIEGRCHFLTSSPLKCIHLKTIEREWDLLCLRLPFPVSELLHVRQFSAGLTPLKAPADETVSVSVNPT